MMPLAPMGQEQAEVIALKALAWFVADDELCPVFMNSSGLQQSDLTSADDLTKDFLTSVLAFLLMDDVWIMRFCDSHNLSYDFPKNAYSALSGGSEMHWT